MNTSTHPSHHHGHQGHGDSGPQGLHSTQDGYTLTPAVTRVTPGEPTDYRFRIVGPNDTVVTDFATTHEKQLHLIVVRRDLTGFWHLHPTTAGDGVWSVKLNLPEPGQYRVFADFTPAPREQALTLGVDLTVTGEPVQHPLADPAPTFAIDGYQVQLDGELRPGHASQLGFTVTRDGLPVTNLQPYLAAYGHLVALRAGDLAYVHVHPDGTPGDGVTEPGPGIAFQAHVPGPGTYRLFLDFQHEDTVHTAQFTRIAE